LSLEEMAEKYSKKWGVPMEEAQKKIQQFLEKKPGDRDKVALGVGDLFPEPLGPISQKIQDINAAAISTAYTHKSLRELSQPPEELKTLREKVEYIEKAMDNVVGLVNTTMKEWKDTLEAKKAEEEREKLVKEINEKVIQPLKEKVDQLEKAKAGDKQALAQITPETILETGEKMTREAQAFLKKQGYNVELPEALTMDQVEAKINESVTIKKKEWEKESGTQVEVEKERILATEKILTGITDRLFDVFLEPIKAKIQEAIEKGAFARTPPTGT